jgi:hypothetical protein
LLGGGLGTVGIVGGVAGGPGGAGGAPVFEEGSFEGAPAAPVDPPEPALPAGVVPLPLARLVDPLLPGALGFVELIPVLGVLALSSPVSLPEQPSNAVPSADDATASA